MPPFRPLRTLVPSTPGVSPNHESGIRAADRVPSDPILTSACYVRLMSSIGLRGVTSCMISCAINLGFAAWGLYVLGNGWDLRQSGGDFIREGSATFLAGGLFLFLAGLAGIIHAMISLGLLVKRSKRPPLARASSLDTSN